MLSKPVSTDEEEIKRGITDILKDDTTNAADDLISLKANINAAGKPWIEDQLKWLYLLGNGPEVKRELFFDSVVSWGNNATRLELLSEIYHVESKEPGRSEQGSYATNGTKPNSKITSQSRIYCVIAAEVVRRFEGDICDVLDKKDNNILHLAARKGTPNILKAVIESIRVIAPNQLDDLALGGNKSDETPLEIASTENEVPLVKLLAEFDDGKRKDHVLKAAKQGRLELLKALLNDRDDVDTLLTTNVLKAVAKSQESGIGNVWRFITQKMRGLEKNIELLTIAISNHQVEIVSLILNDHPLLLGELLDGSIVNSAAHIASRGISEADKMQMLRRAKKTLPEAEKVKICYDLEKARESILGMVLEKMVRNLSIYRIKLLWPKEDGKTKEACLDLNLLNSRNGGFARFVNTAKREVDELFKPPPITKGRNTEENAEEEDNHVSHSQEPTNKDTDETRDNSGKYRAEFHPILKYVAFPDLDETRQHSLKKMEGLAGKEVNIVLDWLRMIKGVQKIIELRVPDSRYEPHSEETIEDAAIKFKVEELNWKRIDLATRGFSDPKYKELPTTGPKEVNGEELSAKSSEIAEIEDLSIRAAKKTKNETKTLSEIRTLHLYSSGSWTPLCHWMGKEGLNSMSKLRTVHISIIEDHITSKRAGDQQTEVEAWLRKHEIFTLVSKPNDPGGSRNISSVKCIQWKRAGPKKPEHGIPDVSRYPSRVTKLENFLDHYRKRRRGIQNKGEVFKPIKVAIIDTGVDESDFNTNIHKDGFKGESFVEREDMESHWWLSSDTHGTQMAKIISSIDPFCQLYIAKVGDYKEDITVGRVAKAIDWAAGNNVDIISMSFALDKENTDLTEAVAKAASERGIVLICSTADEGNNKPDVWPASCTETINIAACDEMGYLAQYSNARADYYFQGQRIVTDATQFTDSRDEICGSSVSTALAAGVASLILACCRIDRVDVMNLKRKEMVQKWFDKMKGKDLKYVRPWVVFGEGPREAEFKEMFLPEKARKGL